MMPTTLPRLGSRVRIPSPAPKTLVFGRKFFNKINAAIGALSGKDSSAMCIGMRNEARTFLPGWGKCGKRCSPIVLIWLRPNRLSLEAGR